VVNSKRNLSPHSNGCANSRKNLLCPKINYTDRRTKTQKIKERKNADSRIAQPSKLRTYINILKILAKEPSVKATKISQKLNVNYRTTVQYIGFLIKQNLVNESRPETECAYYSISERGKRVLKYFGEDRIEISVNDLKFGI
jgi:predicted transcriptional regulator